MKKTLSITIVLALVFAAFAIGPAQAKKRKKKKAAPVETTLYMHGSAPLGEIDGVQWTADGSGPESLMTLSAEEPTGATKSMNYFSPALNSRCTGLPLAFPTFTGPLAGTITGDAKMTAHFVSAPATIKARIWADIGAFTMCNDAYVEPAAEVDVEVPAGQNAVEIVFPGLDLPAQASIMIEILAPSGQDYGGQVGRLLYDSPDAPTSITFSCIPASGTSCVPAS